MACCNGNNAKELQACLRPRDRFWDIPVPKIYHEAEDTLVMPLVAKTTVMPRKASITRFCIQLLPASM
ncbi:hypothetical protein, partial [Thiolapillus sp.]|uniref:hypothetical protein n=1 Tax=Thiolapillus sp. TaxID=2017437 RepID=UPI003AF79FF8